VGRHSELKPAWTFSCPDWAERLKAGRSLVPDLPLNRELADKAVAIFNNFRLPDVKDQPALADSAGEWQRDIVRAAFGSLDPVTRKRMIRKIFAMVPKKNSKTTGGAAIALTATILNDRPNAELQLIGPTQEIAQLAFDQAWGMIDADPEGYLAKRFLVRDHVKTIEDRLTGAELKIKTFDMKVTTGAKPVFVLLDELHLMAAFSYATRVFGQIEGNMTANAESLIVVITTQSDVPPAGVFKQELQYARGIRDGKITERVHTLPILYEFPETMQRDKAKPWLNPKTWPMVLPNLGLSITVDRLIDEFTQAQEKGEAEIRRWASQHLNVEIGMALHSDRWAGADHWEPAADPTLTLDELLSRSEVVVVGIDGGGLDDLLGLAVMGRCKVTKDWLLWNRAWAQSDVFERRKDIAETLTDFHDQGDLMMCEDPTDDIHQVADIVERIADAGLLPEANAVGLDPQLVAAIVDELANRGITEAQMVGIPQGYRLSGAIWGMERKLKDGTLWHAGQPLMAWCVGNAKAEQRGNAVLITKQAAGKAKIDPLAASFNAGALMSRNPEPSSMVTGSDACIVV
jgi:phage terminase large subunit-like protein